MWLWAVSSEVVTCGWCVTWTHVFFRLFPYQWVMCRITESLHIWVMSHTSESCHTHLSHATHIWVMSHTSESCHTHLSHVTHIIICQTHMMKDLALQKSWSVSHPVHESCHPVRESCHRSLSLFTSEWCVTWTHVFFRLIPYRVSLVGRIVQIAGLFCKRAL